MKIIALEKELPGATTDQFASLAEAEARRVWELIQTEVITEIFFRRDQNTAVIILDCEDLQDAQQTLSSLPMVESGLIDFDLIPLMPYPGLERLFAGAE